jgi:hypothetical protein
MWYIGVDLGQRAFTACFLEADDSSHLATFPMTPEGLAAFRSQLAPDDRIAVEVGTNAYYFHDQVREAVAEVVLVSTLRGDREVQEEDRSRGCAAPGPVPQAGLPASRGHAERPRARAAPPVHRPRRARQDGPPTGRTSAMPPWPGTGSP